eukprot:14227253-Alexandrium_andersonii.AAC.1
MREPDVGQENVVQFPATLLKEYLGDLYEIQHCELNPHELGWPILRRRQYIHMRLKTAIPTAPTVPLSDFALSMQRACKINYQDLMLGTEEEVQAELVWSAKRRTSQLKDQELPT